MNREDERNMSDDKNRGGASMAPIDKGRASVSPEVSEPATDDRLTYQIEAAQILLAIRDSAFDSNDQKLPWHSAGPARKLLNGLTLKGTSIAKFCRKLRRLPRSVMLNSHRSVISPPPPFCFAEF